MHHISKVLIASVTCMILSAPAALTAAIGTKTNPHKGAEGGVGPPVLWRNPADIASRNLFYGSGGKAREPKAPFTFDKEDLGGSQPKFSVIDGNGVEWSVKLGDEARPEVAASRFVWATGYFANDNYFLPVIQVRNLRRLRRGNEYISKGAARNVRLEKKIPVEQRLGRWSWRENPFTGTREWYGLRVLMAMMNNWDVKNRNNSIYQVRGANPEQHYVVSDLGGSFGPPSLTWTKKGDAVEYADSRMIDRVSAESVDFRTPAMPPPSMYVAPPVLVIRGRMRWLGEDIPIGHARWMGQMLGQLSPAQIRDAFRGAGYSPQEVEALSRVVERRIGELKALPAQNGSPT